VCNIRTSLLAKTIAFIQNVVQAQLKIHVDKLDLLDDVRLTGCAVLLVAGMPKSGLGGDDLTDSESPSQAYELKQAVYGVRKRFHLLEVLSFPLLPVSLISLALTLQHSYKVADEQDCMRIASELCSDCFPSFRAAVAACQAVFPQKRLIHACEGSVAELEPLNIVQRDIIERVCSLFL